MFKNFFNFALIDLTNVLMLIDELIFNLFTINNNVVFNTIFNLFTINNNVVFNTNAYIVIIEIVTSCDIIIYEDKNARDQLKKIIDQFSTL